MTTEQDKLTLLRMYLDEELEPDDRARVEQMLSEDPQMRQALVFERCLHEHVGRALSQTEAAPAELRDSIRTVLRTAESTEAAHEAQAEIAGRLEPTPAAVDFEQSGLRRLFAGPRRVNIFAAAAAVVVIVGAVLFGLFGPSIDNVRPSPANLVVEAARFTSDHHDECLADPAHRASELRLVNVPSAQRNLTQHLGGRFLTVMNLRAAGYEFQGAGPCEVPGYRVSAHMLYRSTDESRPRTNVSIYAVPDLGQYRTLDGRMRPLQWYRANGGPEARHRVMRITDGRLVYFVVCDDVNALEAVCGLVERQLTGNPDR